MDCKKESTKRTIKKNEEGHGEIGISSIARNSPFLRQNRKRTMISIQLTSKNIFFGAIFCTIPEISLNRCDIKMRNRFAVKLNKIYANVKQACKLQICAPIGSSICYYKEQKTYSTTNVYITHSRTVTVE